MLGDWGERASEEYARKFNTAQRQALAKEKKALPDGSYPIASAADIGPALTLAKSGHGDTGAAMTLIRRRAKELGVKLDEKAVSAHRDNEILKSIEGAIKLQTGDNDSPSDAKVMKALQEAHTHQMADIKEG